MKRWFISIYLAVLAALCVVSLYALTQPIPWLAAAGLFLAAAAPLTFFIWLGAARPPRTDAHPLLVSVLSGLGAVIAMVAVYRYGDSWQGFLGGSIVALAGWMAYVRWYSVEPVPGDAPVPGEVLPDFTLEDADGRPVSSKELDGRAAVLVFYRGNWCPLCSAQIRELAAAWRQVARHNARLWFVSSQPQKQTRQIAERFSIPASFLRDPGNRVAQLLGIEARGTAPAGMEALGYPRDAAIPTVIVVDAQRRIRFIEVARNYRLRPDPSTYLKYVN